MISCGQSCDGFRVACCVSCASQLSGSRQYYCAFPYFVAGFDIFKYSRQRLVVLAVPFRRQFFFLARITLQGLYLIDLCIYRSGA